MSVKLGKIKVLIVLVLLASALYYCLLSNANQLFVYGINYRINWLVSLSIYFDADTKIRFEDNLNAFQKVIVDDLDIAETLLINNDDIKGEYAIYVEALNKNNLAVVELILKHRNYYKRDYDSIYYELLKVKGPEVLKFLAKKRVDLSCVLMQNVIDENVDMVKLLLELNVNVNAKFKESITPILAAVITRNVEIIKLLVAKGAEVNCKYSDGDTPLIIALRNNLSIDIIKLLIERGASVNARNIFNECPLSIAIEKPKNEELFNYLILKGADTVSKSNAFARAIQAGRSEYLKIIKDSGFELKDLELNEIIFDGNYIALKYLIENGIDMSEYLIKFVKENRTNEIKTILKAGCNVNCKDKTGYFPLIGALENKNFEILQILINYGADINMRDNCGNTVLMKIPFINNLHEKEKYIQLIINSGVDINAVNNNGENALLLFMKEKVDAEFFKLLLENGAKFNFDDKNTRNALFNLPFEIHYSPKYNDLIYDYQEYKLSPENKKLFKQIFENLIKDNIDYFAAALKNNDLSLIENFLKIGFNLPTNSISMAINYNCDVKTIKFLLKNTEFIYSSFLTVAVKSGNINILKILLAEFNDRYQKNHGYFIEPFSLAVELNKIDLVKIILDSMAGDYINDAMRTENFFINKTPLTWSIINGYDDIAKLLIEKGANIEVIESYGLTPLAYAAWYGRMSILDLLIQKGADVNKPSKDGTTPLMYASMAGNNEVVSLLIEKGAAVDLKNVCGINAMVEAITSCRTETVELLKKKGADFTEAQDIIKKIHSKGTNINETGGYGVSALMYTIFNNDFINAKYLIDNGADVNAKLSRPITGLCYLSAGNITPLGLASLHCEDKYYGSIDLMKLLIDKKADPYYKNDEKMFINLLCGSVVTSKLFLEKVLKNRPGSMQNLHCSDPFIKAIQFNKINEFEMLLKYGVNPDKENDQEFNGYDYNVPFINFCAENASIKYIELLFKYGVDIKKNSTYNKEKIFKIDICSQTNEFRMLKYFGSNAIAFAERAGCNDSYGIINKIDYLSKNGYDIDQKNLLGYTPLMLLAMNADYTTISHVLDMGVDINNVSTDELKLNVLFMAAMNKSNPEIIELLIDKGADISHRAKSNWTPLMVAVRAVNYNAVEIFIRRGCPIDALNDENQNALDVAYRYYNKYGNGDYEMKKIIFFLKNKGLKQNRKIYELKVD